MGKSKQRDFLTLQDYSAEETWEMLSPAKKIKAQPERFDGLLRSKSILLLFQKASTRTRISFEVAVNQLGGFPITLGWSEAHLGGGRPSPIRLVFWIGMSNVLLLRGPP